MLHVAWPKYQADTLPRWSLGDTDALNVGDVGFTSGSEKSARADAPDAPVEPLGPGAVVSAPPQPLDPMSIIATAIIAAKLVIKERMRPMV